MPRGCYEPWGIFRKPLLARMKVSDCLKQFQTGGLRRLPNGNTLVSTITPWKVVELDRAGKVVWESKENAQAIRAERR